MAVRDLKARVSIDGEKEYKQALNNLNSGNRVLASEMQLLQERYKGSENSMEALRAKSDVLQRQLLQQKDKVETLRSALKNSAEQVGEADKRTQAWQIKLNSAEREEIKLQRALDATNKEIAEQGDETDKAGKKMVGLGDTIEDVAGKLGIRIPDGAKKALNSMEGFSAGTVAKMSAVAAGVALAAKGVRELNKLTLEAAANADALLTRSAQTGLGTELLQQLDYAQRFLDFDGIDKTLVKLTASMDAARDGAEKQTAAFETLGVSVTNTDGTLKDNWETFLQVIDALGQVENATERDALAQDLLGKNYAEMKPLIDAGTDALRAYTEEAQRNGLVLTQDQVAKLGEVDDAHQKLQAQIEATKNKMAADFAPAVQSSMETATKATKTFGETLEETHLIENAAAIASNFMGILDAGTALIDSLPSWLNPINGLSNDLKGLAVIAATVADTLQLLAGLMPQNWGSGMATTALGWNLDEGKMSHLQQLKYSDPKYVKYNASGTDYWRGGLTWVGEGGPELVELPRGSKIYSNQESTQLVGSGTDTSRIELLLGEAVGMLRQLHGDVGYLEDRRRMA